MKTTRKALIAVLCVVCLVCVGLFTLTACKSKELASIAITTPPAKVDYVSGETFDKTGIAVTATYSDESTAEVDVTALTFDKTTLTVGNNSYSSTVNVKVTYAENGKEATATQKVTVHNYITAATVTSKPTTTEYFIGQQFSANGMVINATLEDKTTKSITVADDANAKITPEGALSKDVTEVTVTIGGFDIKVPVSMLNALYVEAETGYRNGAVIDQSTGDSGNLRTDSKTSDAQAGAKSLYEAHLKAQFAVAQMKEADEQFDADALAAVAATPDELSEVFGGTKAVYDSSVKAGGEIISKLYVETVKWLKDTANKTAIDAYVAGDEFKAAVDAYVAGTNEDKKDWNYASDVEKYTAHAGSDGNEYYLGQNNQGNVISFLFDSDKAATGSIQFRLSSAYLYADTSWKPIIMGDIQFNKLAEFYVNGVKYDIPDSTILFGGKTEDGSTNQILWVNWATVKFDNVSFMEGRNVIELKILNHGITAQEGYNFAANIDTLLVAPSRDAQGNDTSKLDTYPADKKIEVEGKVSALALAKDGDKVVLTITGTISGGEDVKGYVGDKLSVKVGDTTATLNISGSNFVATVDVSKFAADEHALTIAGANLAGAGLTVPETVISIDAINYKLALNEDSNVVLIKEDTRTIDYKATGVELKNEEGTPYMVITGTISWSNVTEANVAAFLNEKLGSGNGSLDFQGPLPGKQDRVVFNADDRIIAVTGITADSAVENGFTGTFTVKIDLSKMAVGNFATHFGGGNLDFLTDAEKKAAKPDSLTDEYKALFNVSMVNTTELKIGHSTYQLAYEPWYSSSTTFGNAQSDRSSHFYGAVGLIVTNDQKLTNKGVSADIAVEDGKVVYIVNGTYTQENYSNEELIAALGKISIDLQGNPNAGGTGWNDYGKITLIEVIIGEDGTYTAKYDITDNQNNAFTTHYYATEGPSNGDFKPDTAFEKVVELGGKTYKMVVVPKSGDGKEFWGCVGVIIADKPADAE